MARLTLKEAAVKLGVSPMTLRRGIKKGSIYSYIDNGKYFIETAELDRLIDMYKHLNSDKVDMTINMNRQSSTKMAKPNEVIVIDKNEYDQLRYRLGALEGERQYLLEYQNTNQELKVKVGELEERNKWLEKQLISKRSWWQRLWKKERG